jgi:dephospho-CoA kinase
MLKIGVTGGIGSGKSTVCEIFKQLGISVFNSDFEANRLLETSELINFYKKEFGEKVYSGDKLDKQKIANLIFNNPEALQKVNAFVHPVVNEQFVSWAEKQKNSLFVIKESALLLDSNNKKDLDYIILVFAPRDLRIKRVKQRDGKASDDILNRVKNQASDEANMKQASFIISNDEQSLLLPQVLTLYNMFTNEIKNKSESVKQSE